MTDKTTPMQVFFLGSSKRGADGNFIDDGFDYRDPNPKQLFSLSSNASTDAQVPFRDEHGRSIIRLGRDVSLPFRIHCFGHDMTFENVGDRRDDMYELRQYNGRYLIYRCDPPFVST